MIRDLVEVAIDMVREEKTRGCAEKARSNAEERLLDLLLPAVSSSSSASASSESGIELVGFIRAGLPPAHPRKNFASSLREASLTSAMSNSTSVSGACLVRDHLQSGRRGDGHQFERHAAQPLRQRTKKRKMKVSEPSST